MRHDHNSYCELHYCQVEVRELQRENAALREDEELLDWMEREGVYGVYGYGGTVRSAIRQLRADMATDDAARAKEKP